MKLPGLFFISLIISYRALAQPMDWDQRVFDNAMLRLPVMKDDSNKVKLFDTLSAMHIFRRSDLCIQYGEAGKRLADSIDFPQGKIRCMGNLAFLYAINGEWVKAAKEINDGTDLSEKYLPGHIIYFSGMRFINEAFRGDMVSAKKYALETYRHPHFSQLPERDRWPTFMQLARSYAGEKKLDSARYFADIIRGYQEKGVPVIPDLIRATLSVYGLIEEADGNSEKALHYYRTAPDTLALASLFHKLKQSDSALWYAEAFLRSAEERANRVEIKNVSVLLADIYRDLDVAKAFTYLARADSLKDKLNAAEQFRQLENLNLEKQSSEFRLHRELAVARNRFRTIFFLSLVGLLLVVAIYLLRTNRQKQKANSRLEATLQQLKATQAQLIQSEKMASLGSLTAGIAHEIQNPLNFVNNFAEVNSELLQELKEEIRANNYAAALGTVANMEENESKISFHGKRADAIVKSMLQHSRSSSGKKELTDINALVDEYARLAYQGYRAKEKGFNTELDIRLDGAAGNINIVPQDIGRVLLNIIGNACYAVFQKTQQGRPDFKPRIDISTKKLSDQVRITIRDNGSGIPKELADKVFQPFFTTKPTGEGTGLGLSLSYDIITKAHQGMLSLDTKPGEYTEFVISLPL